MIFTQDIQYLTFQPLATSFSFRMRPKRILPKIRFHRVKDMRTGTLRATQTESTESPAPGAYKR
ncbi:hypothetical protein LINPERHAP1_LOCUS27214 [Linum perenne]